MIAQPSRSLASLTLDHIEFYVRDAQAAAQPFVHGYLMPVYSRLTGRGVRSLAVGSGDIRLVLTEAVVNGHPAADYVTRHGDGVADIALSTANAESAFAAAVRRGARVVAEPANSDGIITATIGAFGDLVHTFVQRPDGVDRRVLPGFVQTPQPAVPSPPGLLAIDHLAVCLEAGQLAPTVSFYEDVLDFQTIFTERIEVADQAMDSQVVQSRSGAVTLTLIEPDTHLAPGQIDAFLKHHGGAGIQHIALLSNDIVASVRLLTSNGVEFLNTPDAYYQHLTSRLRLERHAVEPLHDLGVLVDEDHDGQLFQIFTRSIHPHGTLFMEVIERLGAKTFGTGNIKALYEAVEMASRTDGD